MSLKAKVAYLILTAGLLMAAMPQISRGEVLPDQGASTAILSAALAGNASLDDAVVRGELARLAPRLNRQQQQALEEIYYRQIIANYTDLEAFACISELAAALAGTEVDNFMLDVSHLALDATSNWQAFFAGPWGRLKQSIHLRLPWFPGYPALGRFGATGFAANDGSNQVQHFWYSVATAYRYGATFADLATRYHEVNLPGPLRLLPGTGQGRGSALDLGLSRQGIALGRALANGAVTPDQVGDWLRANLGRSAAVARISPDMVALEELARSHASRR